MKIKIKGKVWNFIRKKLENHKGYCESPNSKNKSIIVDSRLKGEEELEIILHELLHAAFWFLDEEYVEEISRDFAKILWTLNYRKEE